MGDLIHQAIFLTFLIALLIFQAGVFGVAEISENLLKNPSFEEGADRNGVPAGWSLYAGSGRDQHLRLIRPADSGKRALLIEDNDPAAEIGITQVAPALPGLTYEARVRVQAVEGFSPAGAYLQLRFLPSNRFAQTGLAADSSRRFRTVAVRTTAPPDTESAQIYLYTHAGPTPRVIVDSVRLVSGVEPPPPLPPDPVPPVYTKLKGLHLTTELARNGQPHIAIIVPASGLYHQQAARLQQAIETLTGVRVPIATDESPAGAVPIKGNLIALGHRSTNKTIGELYNRYFTLLDLRYPGPGGYVVRTLHNPFGNGYNVIFAGGSDLIGVNAATDALIQKLRESGARPGSLSIGWLAEIHLGKGIAVPKELKDFETWEASAGYGSVGYFGWTQISKRMAMYFMTGDPFQAREALRLAFPDEQAKKEIIQIDGERIENKDDPLAGPYHYNAHLMILFWDLIEESPVFTDEERLKVTNAFARQLNHRKDEGIYGLTEPPASVGSRHGQWSAISLYCLGRYFQKDYPDPIWQHCVEASQMYFAPLHQDSWVYGESDNLFWYNTGTAPILTYMLLSGDRKPLESGALRTLLRGQEILISGRQPDWALNSAALDYLHKAAYLTQDGRWLTYRNRTGLNLNIFRLGQSFWPEEHLKPALPADLVNRWTIQPLSRRMWEERGSGLPFQDSFQFGSYRSAPDASGDFTLIKGLNGAGRNPYHTFALLELRLNGRTLLQGYRNQLLTWADGLVEPQVAMDSALRHHDMLGQTVAVTAEVPKAACCNWKRTLVQRVGRYALVVDDLRSRTDSQNLEVKLLWERPEGWASPKRGVLRIEEAGSPQPPPGWKSARALESRYTSQPSGPDAIVRLDSLGIVLLRATEPGAWLEMPFQLSEAVAGEIFADFINYRDRGVVRLFLDGKPVGKEFDHYSETALPRRVSLGQHRLAAGSHILRVEAVGKHLGVEKCFIGLAGLNIRPKGASPVIGPQPFEVQACDPLQVTLQGSVATMQWRGPVRRGQHRIFFSLIGSSSGVSGEALSCQRLTENAAALALPSPALAVAGNYGMIQGELAVLEEDHLYGKSITVAGIDRAFLKASAPVDLEWDLTSGSLYVVARQKTRLSLAVTSPGPLRMNGRPLAASRLEKGFITLDLPPGRHVVAGARLAAPIRREIASGLKERLAYGGKRRTSDFVILGLLGDIGINIKRIEELKSAFSTNVGGKVVDMTLIPLEGKPLLCAAEGKTAHLLSPDGQELRSFQTDGPIRKLRWWKEHDVLLVGCTDEKVIAFDRDGNRKWVFVSEMDPAVFRAAKDYWFKTAPGHEGVHGLYTGVFLDGKSQAFVGSACTLEILDENGQLVKRLPVFWGTGSVFAIVNGPEGSLNLLQGRSITDGPWLAIINNRTLDPNPRGFYSVPSGHTYVGGWGDMNRSHLFYEDLDGDGKKEIVSEINGVWNRVTVWNEQGDALYNAQFGPGESITAGPIARTMRDLDIADLDGDGKKEILAATASGLVVALDHRCGKLWSYRYASPPTVLKAVARRSQTPWIVVGCEDGSVVALDGQGKLIRKDHVNGQPTCIEVFCSDEGSIVVLATDQGMVKGFRVERGKD